MKIMKTLHLWKDPGPPPTETLLRAEMKEPPSHSTVKSQWPAGRSPLYLSLQSLVQGVRGREWPLIEVRIYCGHLCAFINAF